MAKCKNSECNNIAQEEDGLCRKCYAKEQEGKEIGQNEVWIEAIKKAKKEHVIFIAYLFAVCTIIGLYGGFIGKVNTASLGIVLGDSLDGILLCLCFGILQSRFQRNIRIQRIILRIDP